MNQDQRNALPQVNEANDISLVEVPEKELEVICGGNLETGVTNVITKCWKYSNKVWADFLKS